MFRWPGGVFFIVLLVHAPRLDGKYWYAKRVPPSVAFGGIKRILRLSAIGLHDSNLVHPKADVTTAKRPVYSVRHMASEEGITS